MRRAVRLSAGLLALSLALAPGIALARAGGGGSMGSRGSMTYSAPPMTNTSPYSAAPMQRSLTPQQAPSFGGAAAGAGASGFGGSRGGMFTSGLMGGLIGAGLGGMLMGNGFFGGLGGGGMSGLFGLLIQLVLVVFVVRFLFRMFANRGGSQQPMFAGLGNLARGAMPNGGSNAGPGAGAGLRPAAGGSANQPVAIGPTDYQAFEQLLKNIQAAWTSQDIGSLRALATPEMLSYFGEQLADQASRGVRNSVTNVNLDRGDLSEAWAESGREYATVAMRFSMVDVTQDANGRVVDGSPTERTVATELWTFLRTPGGRWILSAIQQAK